MTAGEQRGGRPKECSSLIPTRLDRAQQLTEKHKQTHPAIVSDAQFCFPLGRPAVLKPRLLGPRPRFQQPDGDQCKADGHPDTEFPGVTMCRSKQWFVRAHGCMWCGETSHARPQCVGPTLPASQVQMTLPEWQKFEPQRMRTHQDARDFDRKTFRQKDGKPTQGVALRERSASRPRSCRPIKRADGSVET